MGMHARLAKAAADMLVEKSTLNKLPEKLEDVGIYDSMTKSQVEEKYFNSYEMYDDFTEPLLSFFLTGRY